MVWAPFIFVYPPIFIAFRIPISAFLYKADITFATNLSKQTQGGFLQQDSSIKIIEPNCLFDKSYEIRDNKIKVRELEYRENTDAFGR